MDLPRNRLWTVDEVAHYLQLKPATLLGQRREGQLPGALGFKVDRRNVRFRPADIDVWLASQRVKAE